MKMCGCTLWSQTELDLHTQVMNTGKEVHVHTKHVPLHTGTDSFSVTACAKENWNVDSQKGSVKREETITGNTDGLPNFSVMKSPFYVQHSIAI